VLSTGYWGGYVLPGEASSVPLEFNFAACKLEPEGLDALAGSGEVWMVPEATWLRAIRRNAWSTIARAAGGGGVSTGARGTLCGGPARRRWKTDPGNRAHDLDLLLNSLGPREGHHFYWDESLHGDIRSNWSYAAGPSLTLLWTGLAGWAADCVQL
jgi:hypothetical protein